LCIATFGLAVGLSLGAGAEDETKAPAKCLKAEINPVTGHTMCIDPLGSPVEAAPKVWLRRGRRAVRARMPSLRALGRFGPIAPHSRAKADAG